MTFPPDSHMLVLVAIITGEQLVPNDDGELDLTVENGIVPGNRDALDHLESVGWIEVYEGGVRATDHGRRGADRWMTKVCRLKGRNRAAIGRGTRVSGTLMNDGRAA